MRTILPLLLAALLAQGCTRDKAKDEEIARMKKRVSRLEGRVKKLEALARKRKPQRGKKPVPRPGRGPMRQVALSGDAAQAILASDTARFALPGRVPVGSYQLLAAFGDDPLVPIQELEVPQGPEPLQIACDAALRACKLKEGPTP